MYALILLQLILSTGTFTVDNQMVGTYNNITECFHAREQLIGELHYLKGNELSEFPPENTQLVCIRVVE